MHRPIAISAIGLLLAAWTVAVADWLLRADQVPPLEHLTWSTPQGRAVLESWGLSAPRWAGFLVITAAAVVAASMTAAWLLLRERPSPFRSYTAVTLVLFATVGGHVSQVTEALNPRLQDGGTLLQGLGWVALFQLAYVFPDGRFVPRWTRWAPLAWVALLITGVAVELSGVRPAGVDAVESAVVLALLGTGVGAQVYRYRRVSDLVDRAQARGVLVALALWLALGLVLILTPLQGLVRSATMRGMAANAALEVVTSAILVLVPVSIAMAIVRRQSVVVRQLGERLADAVPPDRVAQQLVDTVRQAMRVPGVVLRGEGGLEAVSGTRSADPQSEIRFPITYLGEQTAELAVSPGPGGLSRRDHELLADVTRQAAVAIRAATTTAALRTARERLVTAREEERRRLHRDLHDGLGPTLASVFQRVDLAATLLPDDVDGARRILLEARDQTVESIADLRRLVLGLRPPALDELGLAGLIEESGRRVGVAGRPDVSVRADSLPTLPASVEVAGYRIVMEALTNVVRHADADTCTVRLDEESGILVVRVQDDGRGIDSGRVRGGMSTMRERAEELGGTLEIGSGESGGTTVTARLPLYPPAGAGA